MVPDKARHCCRVAGRTPTSTDCEPRGPMQGIGARKDAVNGVAERMVRIQAIQAEMEEIKRHAFVLPVSVAKTEGGV